ncbi:MAG: retropepsin-like aspartic protease [Candidatus Saccharimonadales bacterium]
MDELDLSKLLGGKPFVLSTQVAQHGISVPTQSLADTGANGRLFMDTQLGIDLAKSFQIKLQRLPTPGRTKGFDGTPGTPITHVIFLNFRVNGRRFLNSPFLLADLGQHDIIIGRKWMADQDVWLDVKNRQLFWPDDRTPEDILSEPANTVVPKEILQRPAINPIHQADMERRDKLFERKVRWQPSTTFEKESRGNILKMNWKLKDLDVA